MISYNKDISGNITAAGFKTLEDAEADCARLRVAWGSPYSFTVFHPTGYNKPAASPRIAQEADGTFSFRYWKAASCD